MTNPLYKSAMSAPIQRDKPAAIPTRPSLWRRIVWRIGAVLAAIFPVSP
jgi:hypothetical protein